MPRHTGRCGHRPLHTAYRNPMRHIRAEQTHPPLRPSTVPAPYPCSVIPRARSARGNPHPVSCQQRPKAATYLCRSAAKARFDNRQPPEGVSKEGGPQPSLFGRSRMGDFQGGRKIETSFPLEWRFWLLLPLLTKVTRRRQKKKNIPGGADPSAPTFRLLPKNPPGPPATPEVLSSVLI